MKNNNKSVFDIAYEHWKALLSTPFSEWSPEQHLSIEHGIILFVLFVILFFIGYIAFKVSSK